MGWVKKGSLHIPSSLGSARYLSANIATITSAAGAGNRKAAQIGRVTWTDGLSHDARYVSYLSGAVTADAAAKLRTSLQGKVALGTIPDGVILSAGVGANNAFSDDPLPAASTWTTVDLGAANAPTLAQDQMIAVVHEIDPDNIGTVGSVGISCNSMGSSQGEEQSVGYSNPTWTPVASGMANIMLTATDGTYGYIGPFVPGQMFTTTAFNSGSATNRFASVFDLDADYKIRGARVGFSALTASFAEFNMVLRDGDGVQIGNNTQHFISSEIVTATQPYIRFLFPDGPHLGRRGSRIMISCEPIVAQNVTIGTIKFPNATIQAAASMGTNVGLRTYTSGAWDAIDPLSRTVWSLIVAEEFVPGLGGGARIDRHSGPVEID